MGFYRNGKSDPHYNGGFLVKDKNLIPFKFRYERKEYQAYAQIEGLDEPKNTTTIYTRNSEVPFAMGDTVYIENTERKILNINERPARIQTAINKFNGIYLVLE